MRASRESRLRIVPYEHDDRLVRTRTVVVLIGEIHETSRVTRQRCSTLRTATTPTRSRHVWEIMLRLVWLYLADNRQHLDGFTSAETIVPQIYLHFAGIIQRAVAVSFNQSK